ncbi:alpha/beta fold hydrolase [Nocardioides sp.]|uniref:alpha/beta fold hydrolase n=1 Tax=Nocardioides sp. TaxID=35761 RepID=UPI0026336082|nr:alpha/beta fold hydrolase [Nocardioides sp.]
MHLHTTALGTSGSRVVFLHGLFGQGRNWHTLGKALAERHRVTLVDLPNHGRSEWTERIDYAEMADAVAALLEQGDPVTLVGHSMGGKVAMMVALRHPELVESLVVADMSPVRYGAEDESTTGGVLSYAAMLRDLDLSHAPRREDVDALVATTVPSATVRGFLLQNLRHRDGGWVWAANIDLLARDGAVLADWPEAELAGTPPYDGPVLWIAGGESSYVRPEYDDAMRRWFPRYRKVTMKGVGHWVHSERPELFRQILEQFLGDA